MGNILVTEEGWEVWSGREMNLATKWQHEEMPKMMGMFSIWTVSMPVSWLWYCAIVLQEISIGENWIKDQRTLLFLKTACVTSFIISYDLVTIRQILLQIMSNSPESDPSHLLFPVPEILFPTHINYLN